MGNRTFRSTAGEERSGDCSFVSIVDEERVFDNNDEPVVDFDSNEVDESKCADEDRDDDSVALVAIEELKSRRFWDNVDESSTL